MDKRCPCMLDFEKVRCGPHLESLSSAARIGARRSSSRAARTLGSRRPHQADLIPHSMIHPNPAEPAVETIAEVIRSRRTIHLFEPERVPPDEEILAAIELARWAPNHHLTEPWRFYILGRQTADAIAHLNAELVTKSRGEAAGRAKLERWLAIPGWMVVTSRRSPDPVRDREDYAAYCCAIQSLQLYLWRRGIGTKWTTGKVTQTARFFRPRNTRPACARPR